MKALAAIVFGLIVFAVVTFVWVTTADKRRERALWRRRRREWHDRHDSN